MWLQTDSFDNDDDDDYSDNHNDDDDVDDNNGWMDFWDVFPCLMVNYFIDSGTNALR